MSSIDEAIQPLFQKRNLMPEERKKVRDMYEWLIGAKVLSANAVEYCEKFLLEGANSVEDIVEAVTDEINFLDKLILVPIDLKKIKSSVGKFAAEKNGGTAGNNIFTTSPSSPTFQNYVTLSGDLKKDCQTSSGDSFVIDGVFHSAFHTEKVKLKLTSSKRSSMEKELRFLVHLHSTAKDLFIGVKDQLFDGSNGQIKPCSGNVDALSSYVAIAMEIGAADLASHWNYQKHNNNFLNEVKVEGAELLDILIHAHQYGYVLMDFKPANIVKVPTSSTSFRLKTIDLDSAVQLKDQTPFYLSEGNAVCTPHYVSPEVAKFMNAKQKGIHPLPHQIQITSAIDIFAMGLIAFESMNGMKSLWDVLFVEESRIIEYVAKDLTDQIIDKAVERTFSKDPSIKSWLKHALRVEPSERMTAFNLKNTRSLFSRNAATINVETLATKEDISRIIANTEQIMYQQEQNKDVLLSAIASLTENLQEAFEKFGDSMVELTAQAAVGNRKSQEGIVALHEELLRQRSTGQINLDTLNSVMTRFENNEKLTNKIANSFESIVATNNGGGPEVAKKMDLMISMVNNMKLQISNIQLQVTKVRELTVKIDGKSNNFPRTFIIKPGRQISAKSSTNDKNSFSCVRKIGKFINQKILSNVDTLLWERSVLVFVCPVTMQEVPCGPEGKGYEICLQSEFLKTAIPVLKWGFMFLKIALATQGLGAVVPNIDVLLPPIDNIYLDNLAHSIASKLTGDIHSKVETLLNGDVDSVLMFNSSVEENVAFEQLKQFVRNIEATSYNINANNNDWIPLQTGLERVLHPDDGIMWVSKLGKNEYLHK